MNEQEKSLEKSIFHIEDLKFGSADGVLEVISFSPAEIILRISSGRMQIIGGGLEVKSFDTSSGKLTFEGEISSIALCKAKASFFQKLTK